MRRTPLVLALAAAILLPIAVSAGQGGGAIDRHVWRSTKKLVKTKSEQWRPVSGIGSLSVCATGSVAVTVSGQLAGAPVQLRVLREGTPSGPLQPGAVEITPLGGTNTFSFTFVGPVTNGAQTIGAQWRSPTGNPVRLTQRTISVVYAEGTCA